MWSVCQKLFILFSFPHAIFSILFLHIFPSLYLHFCNPLSFCICLSLSFPLFVKRRQNVKWWGRRRGRNQSLHFKGTTTMREHLITLMSPNRTQNVNPKTQFYGHHWYSTLTQEPERRRENAGGQQANGEWRTAQLGRKGTRVEEPARKRKEGVTREGTDCRGHRRGNRWVKMRAGTCFQRREKRQFQLSSANVWHKVSTKVTMTWMAELLQLSLVLW